MLVIMSIMILPTISDPQTHRTRPRQTRDEQLHSRVSRVKDNRTGSSKLNALDMQIDEMQPDHVLEVHQTVDRAPFAVQLNEGHFIRDATLKCNVVTGQRIECSGPTIVEIDVGEYVAGSINTDKKVILQSLIAVDIEE
jgi:hypothetical protein